MRRLIVHPLAKAELRRAARKYNAETFGVGERLVRVVYAITHSRRGPDYWHRRARDDE